MRWKPSGTIKRLYKEPRQSREKGSPRFFCRVPAPPRGRGVGHSLMGRFVGRGLDPSAGVYGRHRACPPPRGRGGHSLMGRSVGRGLDPSAGVYGRQGACPPPRGRGRACPARGFPRGWAVTGGFRGVGDAAPYVGGCPLTGCRANLRRGEGTPPYGCNSCKRGRGGHSLMGQSVGRGLDPSVGVYGRHRACPPPRGRGRACPARGVSRGWAAAGGFRGGGVRAPRPTDLIPVSAVGAAYMPYASLCGMPFAGCFFSFNTGLAIRLKMYPRCRAWTFDNRLHPILFSVRLHLCF